MNNLLKKAEEILEFQCPRRPSSFQIVNLLVNKEPTHQGRLWRIVEELRAKMLEIKSAEDQISDSEDQISIMKIDLECMQEDSNLPIAFSKKKFEHQKRMAERRILSAEKQKEQIKYIIESRKEEVKILIDLYEELSKKEPIKNWDDQTSQLEYWESKLGNEIAMRTALNMPQDLEVMKMAMNLPSNSNLRKLLRDSINQKMLKIEGENAK